MFFVPRLLHMEVSTVLTVVDHIADSLIADGRTEARACIHMVISAGRKIALHSAKRVI